MVILSVLDLRNLLSNSFHCMEESRVNILQNISFFMFYREEKTWRFPQISHFWVNYSFKWAKIHFFYILLFLDILLSENIWSAKTVMFLNYSPKNIFFIFISLSTQKEMFDRMTASVSIHFLVLKDTMKVSGDCQLCLISSFVRWVRKKTIYWF